ncbi:TonB-dependent receptor [Candidatus Colwellia aromaticivorans]|uniref:TonB-dependent receptor n=1 Tax=Candidatus Colwellia aromaticivorans TaxID=2267621 RepID=UPI000DF43644|nr:TonB-dependent receptor plug domain-containing protein [Candidatus Colwellia aromaticivorans]
MKTKLFNKTLTQIAVASALLSAASSAVANSNESAEDANLEQIVVTANRSQQDLFLSLSATQVIGQAEIEAIQPQNITELLNTVAGVTVANLGGAGQSASVFMRGTNGNHTLILVDGVRVGSATLGTTSFSSMSVGLIDRIEVVKGPRGALWGSDAIGGVIQIFTKKLQSGEGFVTVGLGSNGYWKTEAAIGLGNESNSLTIAGALEETDGFNTTDYPGQEDKDGYDRQSFSLNGQSKLTEQYSLNLISRYEKGGAQYDNKYGGSDENEHENYSVKLEAVYNSGNILVETFVAKSQDEGGTFKGDSDPKVVNEITTKRDQFGFLGQYVS